MNNAHDIGKSFEILCNSVFLMYGGLRWEKTSAGYVHNGVLARDFHEMDILVLHEREALKNSIKEK